jgi:hypothetical protein
MDEVTQRMHRMAEALEKAGVTYAVIGGNAVASWVGNVDKAAVRLTQDVDVLIRRADLEVVRRVLEAAGFQYHETLGVHMFLDGPHANPRQAVHVLFAGEKVEEKYVAATPDVTESQQADRFRVLNLESLVRMKLTSFRDKDRVHLRDLIGVGLIDATWPSRFIPELGARLQQILDTPNG